MPQNQKIETTSADRKLAAILFADIAGYTALMHKDEATSAVLLSRFQSEMQSKVEEYKGSIVNEMGDGMLCVFDTPNDAVRCAMVLKTAFDNGPSVPVRLGIHSGTVVSKGGKVYGNSINVASRIESMGVPGAVLISKRVQQDIKNQSDIQTSSLGSFHFKNVDEQMEVYAISNEEFVVPDRKELKGKFEEKKRTGSRSMIWSISLIAIIIASALFYMFQNNSGLFSNSVDNLKKEILNKRVAVVPFENLTGDVSLDGFGKIAANWVNQGLMDIEDIEVASPFTVQSNMDALGILPNDPSNRASFSELTGAENIITGTYFIKDNLLVSALEIQDAISGKLLHSFSHVTSEVKDKEDNIDQLRSRICGYWASQEMVDSKKIKVPDYEAYQLYLELIQSMGEAQKLDKILAIDSTFYLPRIRFINSNRGGQHGSSQPHFEFLERHIADLSLYERQYFEFTKHLYLGRPVKAFETINRLRLKYPKEFQVNTEAATIALTSLNNPELARSIFDEFPINYIPKKDYGTTYNFRMFHEISIAHELNDSVRLKEHYERMNFAQDANPIHYLLGKIRGASLLKESKEFDYFLNEYFSTSQIDDFNKVALSHWLWSSIFTEIEKEKTRSAALNLMNNSRYSSELKTLHPIYIQFLEGKLIDLDMNSIDSLPRIWQINALRMAGKEMAKKEGYRVDMEIILKKLEALNKLDLSMSTYWGASFASYSIAVILTQLGEPDKAITYLKRTRELGSAMNLIFFNYDPDLEPLYYRPGFQELLKPTWPDVKD